MNAPDVAQLATIYPASRSVEVAGRSIVLKRCGIAQAGRIIDAGGPLYQRMQDDDTDFPELFELFPDETAALIVAATGLDAEWVASLDSIEQFDLASFWLEMNAAFFVRRLLPIQARYRGAINAMYGDGLTSLEHSSPQGTSTPGSTPLKPPLSTSTPSPAPNGAASASMP